MQHFLNGEYGNAKNYLSHQELDEKRSDICSGILLEVLRSFFMELYLSFMILHFKTERKMHNTLPIFTVCAIYIILAVRVTSQKYRPENNHQSCINYTVQLY